MSPVGANRFFIIDPSIANFKTGRVDADEFPVNDVRLLRPEIDSIDFAVSKPNRLVV